MAEEDLIFGKNRHLFGGMEPSNMSAFSGAVDATLNKIKITATLPSDTVVDSQTLCSIAGAVIRRKVGNYPVDEFDGTLLADIQASGTITDQDADPTGTYYYAAFPYSTQGVYNRNKTNRIVVNEPPDMTSFGAVSVYDPSNDTCSVQITADLPAGVTGAIIRRSTSGYPASETEGTLFQDITQDGTYTDSNVTVGVTYYYAAFPYSSNGAYNRSGNNQASVTVTEYEYFFGYDLDLTDSNPATRVTYPADVDNSAYTAAKMDFTTNIFGYGGWPSTAGTKFMPKPCMLKYDGSVDQYLDPNDYTKKEDGITASDVANTSFGGNAMMQWPKIYTKRWVEGNIYKFRCSDIAFDSDYDCLCNYDRQNNVIDHFYTPIYLGSNVSSKMRSISGQSNYVSETRQNEIDLAKANGLDWYTEVLADRLLIQDLLVMMAKSTALQETFGYGRCAKNSNTAAIGQGTMNTKGLFWGDDDQTSGVKVFGMENWWGNLWRGLAGWINANGTQKIKITRGTHDGSLATDYNTTGDGYMTVDGATPTGTSGGYISGCKNTEFGRIPYQASGSSSTNEADGLWFNNAQSNYAFVGGDWIDALLGGGFCVNLRHAASDANATVGAALSCKPLAA